MPDPIHLRKVDGPYIKKFARRMETYWRDQDLLDGEFADMDNLTQVIEVATSKKDSKAETLKAGMIGRQNKKEAAILHILPFSRFNPLSSKPDDIKHANKLESFIVGAAKKCMKTGNTQRVIPDKGVRTGRAWEETTIDLTVWSGDDFKAQAQKIKDAPKGSKEEAEEKLKLMKRDQWPIQTMEVPTRGTWTYFDSPIWLPEVIQIRKMTREAIVSTWGEESLPEGSAARDTTEIPVFKYSNHKYSIIVIDGKAPNIVHTTEHDLGMNPVQLGEFVRAPENDRNIRWMPSMYHAISLAKALDEALSDWHTSQRENTLAQPLILLDKTEYNEDAMENGRPAEIKVEPGGKPIMGWISEEFGRYPGPLMNEQASFYLNFLYRMIQQEVKTPLSEGDFKSGTSNNLAITANQLSERELDPMIAAIKALWEAKTKLIMRAVVRINRDFPSRVDMLSVHGPIVNGKTFIEVGPDDVIGREDSIHIRAEKAIPIDKNMQLAQAMREKEIGGDKEIYMGQTMGWENPDAITVRRYRDDLGEAVKQVLVAMTVNRTIVAQQALTPAEQNELATLEAEASPEFLAAANPEGQAASNDARTGVPQEPQGLGRK